MSHRDLARATPSSLVGDALDAITEVGQRRAKEIMRTKLVTLRPEEPLRHAAQRMLESELGCLLATDGPSRAPGCVARDAGHKISSLHQARAPIDTGRS